MFNLDTATKSLQILLGGAITTTQPSWTSSYVDIETTTFGVSGAGNSNGAANSATAVTIVAAPTAAHTRKVNLVTFHNDDSVAVTVTLRLNDNGTFRPMFTVTLQTLEYFVWADGRLQVFTVNGELKVSQ